MTRALLLSAVLTLGAFTASCMAAQGARDGAVAEATGQKPTPPADAGWVYYAAAFLGGAATRFIRAKVTPPKV